MALTRAQWIEDVVRRRLAGVEGRRRDIRARYESSTGRPWHTTAGADASTGHDEGLTEIVFRRLDEANARRDTSLAPYVDKFRVREYVAAAVGSSALVPLIWTGRNPMAIPTGVTGVLKTNHMSQAVLIMRPDTDPWLARRKATRWMAENYYWTGGEYQYRAIRPRLLLEELLDDGTEYGPRDYSFWCLHGEPVWCQTRDASRRLRQAYSLDWEPMPGVFRPAGRTIDIPRPAALDRMTHLARTLSAPFSFVRVDLYDVHGRAYFGELTFTPGSGRLSLRSRDLDRYLGHVVRTGADALPGVHERIADLAAEHHRTHPLAG